jgi:hypothetical protein
MSFIISMKRSKHNIYYILCFIMVISMIIVAQYKNIEAFATEENSEENIEENSEENIEETPIENSEFKFQFL